MMRPRELKGGEWLLQHIQQVKFKTDILQLADGEPVSKSALVVIYSCDLFPEQQKKMKVSAFKQSMGYFI